MERRVEWGCFELIKRVAFALRHVFLAYGEIFILLKIGSNTVYSRFLIILFLQFFAILNFNFCDFFNFFNFCDFYKKIFFCYYGDDFAHTLVKGIVLRHTRGTGVRYPLQNTRCYLHTGLVHDAKRISNDIF